jgi:hypothetical protein
MIAACSATTTSSSKPAQASIVAAEIIVAGNSCLASGRRCHASTGDRASAGSASVK